MKFRAPERRHRRRRGHRPGVGGACRGRAELERGRAAGCPPLEGLLRGCRRRDLRAADPRRLAALPAQARHSCDREGRHGDAVQARQARRAAPRPAAARERAHRLGRHLARVPPPRLWASREARGREVRCGDQGCPGEIPASPRADTGWNRRREDLPRARAGRVVHEDRQAGGDRASRATGGGIQHDRAPLRREAGVARTGERPHPAEHHRPGAAAARSRQVRAGPRGSEAAFDACADARAHRAAG